MSQIDIKSVQDGVLTMSNNECCSVIETSSINFELKSEAEQDALIENYQNFLNSLGKKLQIVIRIREIDLDNYLEDISNRAKEEDSEVWRSQLLSYARFVKSLVNVNKILSRNFFVVVSLENPQKNFEATREQLALRTEIVSRGIQRLGMHARALDSLEILNLFYGFYNPNRAKFQPLEVALSKSMHSFLVEVANEQGQFN